MEEEVMDDLYASMGSIMMYLDDSLTNLETAKSDIAQLIYDQKLPADVGNRLHACNIKIRRYVDGLGIIRKYIDDIDLTT